MTLSRLLGKKPFGLGDLALVSQRYQAPGSQPFGPSLMSHSQPSLCYMFWLPVLFEQKIPRLSPLVTWPRGIQLKPEFFGGLFHLWSKPVKVEELALLW